MEAFVDQIFSSPGGKEFIRRFKVHYKNGNIWTLETGCLLFSSWMVYYLMFLSPDSLGVLDIIVTIFFILGAMVYFATSSLFDKIIEAYKSSTWLKYLKTANRWIFMVLSFLPGLYYAFKYEYFILRIYLVVHIVTTMYFLYKRFKEFELEPFAIGVGMSVALYFTGPCIRFVFGTGSFGWLIESMVDLGLAVVFLLDLPRKYLPSNMLFGLKIIKYCMFFLSWQTWFILMVFATWTNIGAGTRALLETYHAIEIDTSPKPGPSSSSQKQPVPGPSSAFKDK